MHIKLMITCHFSVRIYNRDSLPLRSYHTACGQGTNKKTCSSFSTLFKLLLWIYAIRRRGVQNFDDWKSLHFWYVLMAPAVKPTKTQKGGVYKTRKTLLNHEYLTWMINSSLKSKILLSGESLEQPHLIATRILAAFLNIYPTKTLNRSPTYKKPTKLNDMHGQGPDHESRFSAVGPDSWSAVGPDSALSGL